MLLFNEIMLLANSQLFENCELVDIQCLISKSIFASIFFFFGFLDKIIIQAVAKYYEMYWHTLLIIVHAGMWLRT